MVAYPNRSLYNLVIESRYQFSIMFFWKGGIYLDNKVLRKLFLWFIQIHILHHANEEAIYGSWMLEVLHGHGYEMSAGTLYPILHNMKRDQLLIREDVNINGKIRKYYRITERGDHVLQDVREKAYELFKEIK